LSKKERSSYFLACSPRVAVTPAYKPLLPEKATVGLTATLLLRGSGLLMNIYRIDEEIAKA
jgi:hypothetical protein